MKTNYRGYEIDVHRVSGDEGLYVSIFRIEDGFEADSFYSSDESPVREYIKRMKERIDNESMSDDPWCEAEHWYDTRHP